MAGFARVRNTPPWADFFAIRDVYRLARHMTVTTGYQHVVDQIIPLQHPNVSGLHVAANLQVVRYDFNAAKLNTWQPDQLTLEF